MFSTALRFCVRGRDGPMPGPQLTRLLRILLLREKADFLLFRTLRVDTASKNDNAMQDGPNHKSEMNVRTVAIILNAGPEIHRLM